MRTPPERQDGRANDRHVAARQHDDQRNAREGGMMAVAMKDHFAFDIDDDDPAGDDVFPEAEHLVLESEIAFREIEHVRIANELRRLRVRLQQVEALLASGLGSSTRK